MAHLYEIRFSNGKTYLYWADSLKDALRKAERETHTKPASAAYADPILTYRALKRRKVEAKF